MDEETKISEALVRFGRMFSKGSILFEGTITAIDEVKFTCTVQISNKENGGDINTLFYDVPLKVLKGSQASLIEIPAINSACTICFKNNNIQRPQIFQIDTCDKILIKIDDQTLTIDANGFVFNQGNNGGLVIVQSNVDRLNLIETDLNNLKNLMFAWIPVPSDGGLALKTAATPWINSKLTKTTKANLEDTKVKH